MNFLCISRHGVPSNYTLIESTLKGKPKQDEVKSNGLLYSTERNQEYIGVNKIDGVLDQQRKGKGLLEIRRVGNCKIDHNSKCTEPYRVIPPQPSTLLLI